MTILKITKNDKDLMVIDYYSYKGFNYNKMLAV